MLRRSTGNVGPARRTAPGLTALILTLADATPVRAAGDVQRGAQGARQCMACHSFAPGHHMTGPSLAGLWGRRVGTEVHFRCYFEALKLSGVAWGPATLVERLGTDGAHVQVLFVTVDPERDTAPVLRKYITAFHPDFLGLRADPTAAAAIAKEFQFFHAAYPIAANGDYAVDRGSALYVYGSQGRRRQLMNGPHNIEAMTSAVAMLLGP